MSLFQDVLGANPYENFVPTITEPDTQGWNGNHRALRKVIDEIKPSVIFDVGVWKGQSTASMAVAAKKHNPNVIVVAIDTWLGSPQHWNFKREDKIHESLDFLHGFPQVYFTFLSNMALLDLSKNVVPLPQTTDNAFWILNDRGVRADVIHIDAAHEYDGVMRDTVNYWRLLRHGGILIGDDYGWPDVAKAANEFAAIHSLTMEVDGPKWWFKKP